MKRKLLVVAFFGSLLAFSVIDALAQVPNMRATVDKVFAEHKWNLGTKPENGCFTEEVAFQLHKLDPNWGHLRKFRETWWNGHAADAVLHKSGYALDIISNSDAPGAKPSWSIEKLNGKPFARYTDAAKYFMVPTAGCLPDEPTPDPGPTDPPAPTDLTKRLEAIQNTVNSLLGEAENDALAHGGLASEMKMLSGQMGELQEAIGILGAAIIELQLQAEKIGTQEFPCFVLSSKVLGNVTACPKEK